MNFAALSDDQLSLIKATVAKNATDDELKLFLYRCKELNLDPLRPGTKVGIIRDDKGHCIGAWCEVYRKDWTEPAREEVSLVEYNTGKGLWSKMKETMIKKVAEVAALRMAFPDQLSGLYSQEEMDQAELKPVESLRLPIKTLTDVKEDHSRELQRALQEDRKSLEKWPDIRPAFRVPKEFEQPSAGNYIARCGKVGGPINDKCIKDIDQDQLMQFMRWLRTDASPKYLSNPDVQDFIKHAEDFINDQKVTDENRG